MLLYWHSQEASIFLNFHYNGLKQNYLLNHYKPLKIFVAFVSKLCKIGNNRAKKKYVLSNQVTNIKII